MEDRTMTIKSYQSQYNLVEFHHYVNQVDDEIVNLVELLIDCPIEEFNEHDFTSIFVIEDGRQHYVFSWYEVDEFYEEDGMVKIVLVK